jgi:thymidine phosphorylase
MTVKKNKDIKSSKGEQTKATVQAKPKSEIVQKHGIVWKDKIDEQIKEVKKVGNVYSADYKAIDDTIEAIKKASRKVSTNDYSANNVYVFLQNCLKKVLDAEK